MSDLDTNELPKISEIDSLKARADLMGVSYHPSIGVEKLRAKVEAKLAGKPDPETVTAAPVLEKAAEEETEGQKRARLKKEAGKMVRINVMCNNPAKREWEGEIFTVGNSYVGTFKKFVPFNTADGWHVPHIMYEMIKARECQIFTSRKVTQGNVSHTVKQGKIIKEFNVEVLPPLSEAELAELARRQAMAAGQAA